MPEMNASLLTDIGLGATDAPYPAVPHPARVRTASAAAPAVRTRNGRHLPRRARSWPEVTFSVSFLPTVDIRASPVRKRRVMRRVEWSAMMGVRGSTRVTGGGRCRTRCVSRYQVVRQCAGLQAGGEGGRT